jgi:hypothetical protein
MRAGCRLAVKMCAKLLKTVQRRRKAAKAEASDLPCE